jgi:hypothetical protein
MHTHSEPACLAAGLVAGLRAPGDILRKADQGSRLGSSRGIGQPTTTPAKGRGCGAPSHADTASSPLFRPEAGGSTTRTLTSGYVVITTLPVFCPVSTYL